MSTIFESGLSIISVLLIILFFTQNIYSVEYKRDEQPAPKSVEEFDDTISEYFKIPSRRRRLLPYLKEKIKNLPPFFSNSHIELNTRSYYFDRSNADVIDNVAWALGGSLNYESGLIKDILSVGAELFTSQKLYGPEDKDGTLLLKPGQEGFTVLGRAYVNFNYRRMVSATFYRQYYDLPYVNKQFSRMVPNTFEGYSASGDMGWFKYIGGYISKIKQRNSDDFISMSNAAGVDEVENGLFMLGIVFDFHEKFSIGAINYTVDDVINIFYSESHFTHTLENGIGIRLSAQITDQRSIGEDLLTGSDFSTQVFSNQVALSYQYTVVRFAFSTTSSERNIINPFGGYPGFISLMQRDFKRAGEDAFLIGLSYNFGKIGFDWFSFNTNFAYGNDAVNSESRKSLPDQKEFNITLDFIPKLFENRDLWLRLRYANLDIEGENESINEFRIILNYYFTLL